MGTADVLGPEDQRVFLRGPGFLFPQQQGSEQRRTLGSTDKDGVSQFPSCSQDPHPLFASKPMASHLPLHLPSPWWVRRWGCSSSSSSREREREEALRSWRRVAQAGGIREDRDQSPSVPSLRGPQPPNYKSMF